MLVTGYEMTVVGRGVWETTKRVQAHANTVGELLDKKKYAIDYYQREYKWETKQIDELIDDLVGTFLQDYRSEHERSRVEGYGRYFLGSIIISDKNGQHFIVDGQQRLTSLTLLLIHLRHLQKDLPAKVAIDDLIFSEKYGERSFNLTDNERTRCLAALFDRRPFDVTNESSESVQNLVRRYQDIEALFPFLAEERMTEVEDTSRSPSDDEGGAGITPESLPYFIDWLKENVYLVAITADSDDDAYTIFETMNDRGLSLSPTDMLKGYLLANITDEGKRAAANERWKAHERQLNSHGKEVAADFFKAWLRSQYATRIRERKKDARPEDYDRIGTEFHRWVGTHQHELGLEKSSDFFRFIDRDLDFYAVQYRRILKASTCQIPGLERIRFNAEFGFTLQNMLLLAPLRPGDSPETIDTKLALVSFYVDILLAWRQWNFKLITHSGMQYAMFIAMRQIRAETDCCGLAELLYRLLMAEDISFAKNANLQLHQQNGRFIRNLLARLTDYVDVESGNATHYEEYLAEKTPNRFEIEHIWADHPEEHSAEFPYPSDFQQYRNRVGDLLLLPKKFNASYGDLPYEKKLPHYLKQNLLARSLHPDAYNRDPGFRQFMQRTGLPFEPYEHFGKAELDARQELYRQIAERIWNPEPILDMLGT